MAFSHSFAYSKYDLINAVKANDLSGVKKLIAEGYDVNIYDGAGNTALSYSIASNNYYISKLLIDSGANYQALDKNGRSIYCSASSSSDMRVKRLFSDEAYSKCNTKVAQKQITKTSTTKAGVADDSTGWFNWKWGTGAILGIGAVTGLALAIGGGSGDSDSSSGGSNRMSPADRNYGMVGEVNAAVLNSILNNSQYNLTVSSGSASYSNFNDYNEIRLAYSLARSYTGRVVASPENSYYLNPNSTTPTLISGTKVKVAVLDSGIQTTHEDLAANVTANLSGKNMAYAYCAQNSTAAGCVPVNTYSDNPNPVNTNVDSGSWHGTFVAGIIGSLYNTVGVTGIAPESELLPYRLTFDDGGYVPNYYIGQAFGLASAEGAVVVNNSYGIPTLRRDNNGNITAVYTNASDIRSQSQLMNIFRDNVSGPVTSNYISQMINAVNTYDTIFVWAAGNDGNSQSSVNVAIPLFFSDFKDGDYYKNFINVVAYDTDAGGLASYSNQCGVTKEYCLTAPGTEIISTSFTDSSQNNEYAIASGTSFAAPMVSGAIAVIKGAFPYLTGAEITKLLFITARDLGAPGVDEVYGWGMLDLERATRPVGAALVPVDASIDSRTYSLASSNMQVSSRMANSLVQADLSFIMLDSFNRTFTLKLNDYIATERTRPNTIDVLNRFKTSTNNLIALNANRSFNFSYSSDSAIDRSEAELSYAINDIEENNYGFTLYYGSNPYSAFQNRKNDFYNSYTLSNSYNYNVLNPYFTTNSSENLAFNNVFKINEKSNFNIGIIHQKYTMDYEETYNDKRLDRDFGSSFSILSGISYSLNSHISTAIEAGILNEFDTVLGSRMNGAFGIGGNNLTYMASLRGDVELFKDKLSLFGKMTYGYTNVNETSDSLIKDMSTLYSNSFAVGLNYNFDSSFRGQRSNISLLLVQPVQIKSGKMNIDLPFARDYEGNIYYNRYGISLKDEVDVNVQLAYNYSVNDDNSFNMGFIYRDYFENEFIFLMNYSKFFNFM